LSSVIARGLACWSQQPNTAYISAHILTCQNLTGKGAYWKLARRQYSIPMQLACFERLGQADKNLTVVDDIVLLPDPPFDQQGCTDMAITVAAAVRTLIPQPACRIQDTLAR